MVRTLAFILVRQVLGLVGLGCRARKPGLVTLPGNSLISPPRIGRRMIRALARSTTPCRGPTGGR